MLGQDAAAWCACRRSRGGLVGALNASLVCPPRAAVDGVTAGFRNCQGPRPSQQPGPAQRLIRRPPSCCLHSPPHQRAPSSSRAANLKVPSSSRAHLPRRVGAKARHVAAAHAAQRIVHLQPPKVDGLGARLQAGLRACGCTVAAAMRGLVLEEARKGGPAARTRLDARRPHPHLPTHGAQRLLQGPGQRHQRGVVGVAQVAPAAAPRHVAHAARGGADGPRACGRWQMDWQARGG